MVRPRGVEMVRSIVDCFKRKFIVPDKCSLMCPVKPSYFAFGYEGVNHALAFLGPSRWGRCKHQPFRTFVL